VTQYYNAVIENKWNFIKASVERKEKQKKIAQEAKNDTQDKQEVEKRKQYFLMRLFNKYLKRKIEKERKDNEKLEETFQNIKKITGISNVKQIVEKIGNKDKDYNHCVAKVNDKEIKIQILREQIKKLNEDYVNLKNEATVDVSEIKKKEEEVKYDEEEQELIRREQELQDELEQLNSKNRNVELIYEKVMENLKFFIIKSDKLQKNLDDTSNTSSKSDRNLNTEEDVQRLYDKFLNLLKGTVDRTFSKVLI
jgi:DNA repair exonuclease SbcCD ATPase subunit